MSEKDPIRLFVTHAFQEHEEYARIFEYLESRDNFFYNNYSDPEFDPGPGGQEAIQEEVRRQIKQAEVVLFPLGVHAVKPQLIDFELQVAQAFKKPIIAIQAFGGTVNVPKQVLEAADVVVGWDDRIIIDNIRQLARGIDKSQLDVIEFDLEGLDGLTKDDIVKDD
jgi:hypothetical protein